MKKFCWLVLLAITMAIGALCQEQPVQWHAAAPGKAIHPGEKFSVKLLANISSGWHMYSITQPSGGPTTTVITVPRTQPFRLDGQISGPPPRIAYDANFEMNTETYEEGAEFAVPVAVTASTSAGDQKLTVDVRFQVCNDTTCMPATTEHLTVPVRVDAIKATSATGAKLIAQTGPVLPAHQPVAPTHRASLENKVASMPAATSSAPKQSITTFLWLAVVMGGLSILTPCVFPMIPMTVSYFVNRSGTSRRSAVQIAMVY